MFVPNIIPTHVKATTSAFKIPLRTTRWRKGWKEIAQRTQGYFQETIPKQTKMWWV